MATRTGPSSQCRAVDAAALAIAQVQQVAHGPGFGADDGQRAGLADRDAVPAFQVIAASAAQPQRLPVSVADQRVTRVERLKALMPAPRDRPFPPAAIAIDGDPVTPVRLLDPHPAPVLVRQCVPRPGE